MSRETYGFSARQGTPEIEKFKNSLPAGYFSYFVEAALKAFVEDYNATLRTGRVLERNKYDHDRSYRGKNFAFSLRTQEGHDIIQRLKRRAEQNGTSLSSFVEWAVVRGIRNKIRWEKPRTSAFRPEIQELI